MNQSTNKYNLEERTAKFGEEVIKFCRKINQDTITKPIISQLIRSSTSVGLTIWKRTEQAHERILKTRFLFVKKKYKKRNTG